MGECHTNWDPGSCISNHDICFYEEEDLDALEFAVNAEDRDGVLGVLAKSEEASFVLDAERGLLLLEGCSGGIVASFSVQSVAFMGTL